MRREYSHPEARNISGRKFGFAQVNRISELSLISARPIEWHTHDETEVICCIKGVLTYEFQMRLNVTLTSGCFLVIPKGLNHRLAGGIDGPCRRISFFLNDAPRRTSSKSMLSEREYRDILADILKHRLTAKTYSSNLTPILVRIADIASTREPAPRERVELRMFTAVLLLAFAATTPPVHIKSQSRLIDESLRWLKDHCHEKVTLDQITAFMGYGKTRFCALFKERTGLPPLEWLVRYRISKAQKLLREDSASVAEIARRVGFEDAAFFSRSFRRRVGFAPSVYRAQNS